MCVCICIYICLMGNGSMSDITKDELCNCLWNGPLNMSTVFIFLQYNECTCVTASKLPLNMQFNNLAYK